MMIENAALGIFSGTAFFNQKISTHPLTVLTTCVIVRLEQRKPQHNSDIHPRRGQQKVISDYLLVLGTGIRRKGNGR